MAVKPDHVIRMEAELEELTSKVEAGTKALHSADIGLNRTQQHLLNLQLDAMRMYQRSLRIRIEYDINQHNIDQLALALDAQQPT